MGDVAAAQIADIEFLQRDIGSAKNMPALKRVFGHQHRKIDVRFDRHRHFPAVRAFTAHVKTQPAQIEAFTVRHANRERHAARGVLRNLGRNKQIELRLVILPAAALGFLTDRVGGRLLDAGMHLLTGAGRRRGGCKRSSGKAQ
ncbi:hypothetical protein D3C76_1080560 [compost metagenome]